MNDKNTLIESARKFLLENNKSSLKNNITISVIKKNVDLSGRKYKRDKIIKDEIEIAKELAKKYKVDYVSYVAGISGNEMFFNYNGTKENLERLLKIEYKKRGKDVVYDYIVSDD
jgi:hypothetical protein